MQNVGLRDKTKHLQHFNVYCMDNEDACVLLFL